MDRPSYRAFIARRCKKYHKNFKEQSDILQRAAALWRRQLYAFLPWFYLLFFLIRHIGHLVSPCTALKQPILSVFGPNEMLSSFVLTTIHPSIRFILILLFLHALAVLFLSFSTREGHWMEIFRWNYSPLEEKGFYSTFVGLSLHNLIVNFVYLKTRNKRTLTHIFLTFFLRWTVFLGTRYNCVYVGIAYLISSKALR